MLLPASVSTVLVHTSLYTLYLVFQCACLYTLIGRRKARMPVAVPILLIFLLTLFALITTQWALTIVDTFEFLEATRYMSLAQIRDGPPLLYTGHHKSAKFALHIVQTLLGNCFLIHRLYIVWNRRLIMIIAPTMLILANFAFGVLGLVPFVNFSLPILALSVIVNFIITVMIAIKVWMMNRASSTHRRILGTAVESAGLYTLFVILSLVSLFISGDSLSSLLSTQGPIIGISVCSIILLDAYRSEDAQTTPLLRHDEDSASSAESESRVDVTV